MTRIAGIAIAATALSLGLAGPAGAEVQRDSGPVQHAWFSGDASLVADKSEPARAEATYRLAGQAGAGRRIRILFWACGPVACDAVRSIETDVRRGDFDRSWRVGVETLRRDRLEQVFVEVDDVTGGGYVGPTLGAAFAT